MLQPTAAPPHLSEPLRWVTTTEMAQIYERPYVTVIFWIKSGKLAAFGMRSYQDRFGKWWIELPPGGVA